MFAVGEFELKFGCAFLKFVKENDFAIIGVGPIRFSEDRDDDFSSCPAREDERFAFHYEDTFKIFDGEKSVIKLAVLYAELVTILIGL